MIVAPRAVSVCPLKFQAVLLAREEGQAAALIHRLKKRKDFLRVAAQRCKWVAPGLIIQMAPSSEHSDRSGHRSVGLGFTVSKKVGNAVERNRARRRLKAAAAQLASGQASVGCDYVVIGRRETLTRPFPLLLQDMANAFRKLQEGKK